MAVAILIILSAIFSSVFRSLTPWAQQYKGEVEHQLSQLLAQPVTIQTMETGWYWFQPVIKLKDVVLASGQNSPIRIEKLYIGINILQSLINRKILTSMLYVDNVHLVLRQKSGSWQVEGISNQDVLNNEMNWQKMKAMLAWLGSQDKLIMRHVSLDLYTLEGKKSPVRDLNLSIINSGSYHKLKGQAAFKGTPASLFQVTGHLQFNPNQLEQTKGQIYFSGKQVSSIQLQKLFPKLSLQLPLVKGHGDLSLWMDLDKGLISGLQAQFKFQDLSWHAQHQGIKQIQSLEANISWEPDSTGWQFQADRIHLIVDKFHWPENQLALKFDHNQNSYQLFVKAIALKSLFSLGIDWPGNLKQLHTMEPHGMLINSQFLIKEGQPNYILTRFNHLGWKTEDKKYQVTNLSGVLNWQPQEGRLELDSEQTKIAIQNLPTQTFSLLNGNLEWKELSEGMRLSIDRFVLSQEDLTLSADAVFDQITKQSLGRIQLNAEFSGKNIQQWIPYIPSKYLKPKLDVWLKTDLKKIAKISGKLIINGMAADFPFDEGKGELSLVSHAVGVELYITPQWPLITELEGYIKLKNRNLSMDIINGDLQGVPIKEMSLKIDDLGKQHENVLIHTVVQGSAQKIQNFVMSSPLKDTLWSLKLMSLKKLILINLGLEVPLSEDKPLLAKGSIGFTDNIILLNNPTGTLTLENVDGTLNFTEQGITDSALTTNLLGHPFKITVQRSKVPSQRTSTTLSAEGGFSIEALKNHFNSPIFDHFKGSFPILAELKLGDNSKNLGQLDLKSDLLGLEIDLPAPLGKIHDIKVPLDVNLEFNLKRGIRVQGRYNEHLSSDVLFQDNKGHYDLTSGQIRLGSAQALDQNIPGLAIVGNLDTFDLPAWTAVFMKFSTGMSKVDLVHYLRIIHLKMGQLTFLKQQFDNMEIKAKLLADKSWSLNLKQKNIAGDLVYRPLTNAVSGYMNHLHLQPIEQAKSSPSYLRPEQIPNLNLRIDNLSVGTKNIGTMTLKSQSSPNRWLIDYCRIETPFYQLNVTGDWVRKEKVNKTNIQLNLQIQNLAKSLERWNIIPVVDANKGEMEFRGHWNNSLVNFSLASLYGSMNLQLKQGVITHLSPETEGKLGLGKLLSILSLQTIPRRLKLDFSDLSQKGFSFDIFQGSFDVKRGIMSTNDSYLDGPVASATMQGNLDLVKRLYDMNVKITPHITASLPIVATIAGGPIAGIAMWAANKILSQGMQKISGYSYKVSGPWSDPIVQQLKIIRGN